jgi:hypothetical protein
MTSAHRVERRVRPRLEALEDRIVPATYYISNLGDTGQADPHDSTGMTGDLRYCLNKLSTSPDQNNRIQFVHGAQELTGTINIGATPLPTIQKNVTLVGPGALGNFPIVVQGSATVSNPYSIITIGPSVVAEIDGLWITGGYADSGPNGGGGGVKNHGSSLSLSNDLISYNTSLGDGGGIENTASDSNLHLSNDVIQYNTAFGNGGGIANFGSLVNDSGDNSKIDDNNAYGNGGGIYNLGGVDFSAGSVNIVYNVASENGGGVYNGIGHRFDMPNSGAIGNNTAVSGGGVFNNGTITLGCLLSRNQAINQGGGLYNFGTANLDINTVSDNQANQGGGIYLASGSTTDLNGTTVQDNILTGSNPAGKGIYEQYGANLTQSGLTDSDDPGGQPYQGS